MVVLVISSSVNYGTLLFSLSVYIYEYLPILHCCLGCTASNRRVLIHMNMNATCVAGRLYAIPCSTPATVQLRRCSNLPIKIKIKIKSFVYI